MSTTKKKKITYTKSPIKATEKSDRIVLNRAWLKGRTNPNRSWSIKLGDKVIVLSGDDKNKVGKVTKVMPKEGKLIVEGVNLKKRHKKSPTQTQGEITEKEFPIWIWSVAIAVEKDGKTIPTRIKMQDGKRVAVKTGENID
ncbi:MAG: 50S ribosomal protein L24 [Candidatus Caenarcaniphilales bacterium]|nr:50S ribosomal protein L24 [Candidatus Caenarcaniphilales bacterium]